MGNAPAFYSEWEPYAAAWTRNLIDAGHVAPGVVDERSIVDLKPADLDGFTQCHFFSGIAVWSYALRLAGWPDDLEVWTGSAPCQPWSAAGQKAGLDDERHLWPAWFDLIRECRPAVIFGEQVSSPDGLAWFDLVSTDLEGAGYAVAALDTSAASVGAPHLRQRLYFVAIRDDVTRARGTVRTLADAGEAGRTLEREARVHAERQPGHDPAGRRAHDPDYWGGQWIRCTDGRSRPVEPGTQPMVDGVTTGRVGLLRAYGNAIVAPLAAEFIASVIDILVGDH